MISSRDDKDIVDFKLVTTYLPILIIIMRTGMLWFLTEATRSLTGCRAVAVVVCFVGSDCILWKHDRFSQICGFCIIPGIGFLLLLCVPLQPGQLKDVPVFAYTSSCVDVLNLTIHWAADVAWAIGSGILLAHHVIGMKVPYKSICVVLGIVLLLVHAFCECENIESLEILLRSFLFYIFCLLFYYGSDSHGDLESLSFVTPHLGMHFLFVEKIVLGASVIIYGCLIAKLYYQKMDHSQHNLTSILHSASMHTAQSKISLARNESTVEACQSEESKDELLKQLRLAQNKK